MYHSLGPSQARVVSCFLVLVVPVTTVAAVTLSTTAESQLGEQTDLKNRLLTIMDENQAKDPLFPLEMKDYIGFACAIAGLLLAAGGGIGGGGILVPIYILILNFPVKRAIPLASVTVLGGAFANNLLNWPKRHPLHADRPCVDWNLMLQLEPMTSKYF
jgi:hypothetical protein